MEMILSRNRIVIILLLALGLTALTGTAYVLFRKFLSDREAAQGLHPADQEVIRRVQKYRRGERKPMTGEELEQMRKRGESPKNANPAVPAPQPNLGADAAQRSLKTIEEINRINEMNRRLMQQERH